MPMAAFPGQEQYGYEHHAQQAKLARQQQLQEDKDQLRSALKLEESRQQVEHAQLAEQGRLSEMTLPDAELLQIHDIATGHGFRGHALQERWLSLCAAPHAADEQRLEQIEVLEWLPADRDLAHEWQALLCKERERYQGAVVEIHGEQCPRYYMFVYATKKPLMPYWLSLEVMEVVQPSLEQCQQDSFEEALHSWRQRFRVPDMAVTPGSLCRCPEEQADLCLGFYWDGKDYVSDEDFWPVTSFLPEPADRVPLLRAPPRQNVNHLPEEVLAEHPSEKGQGCH